MKVKKAERTLLRIVVAALLLVCAATVAHGEEKIKRCGQCGMHLADYGRSRMVIVYDDGTTVEVCSIHCAAGNIKQNRDKQVKSLMVADYATKELIDARSAVWVIGGRKEGVMTALPKWAFAKEADAQAFMKENGGETAPFEQVMKEAEKETAAAGDNAEEHHGHAHGGHSMGPGADAV